MSLLSKYLILIWIIFISFMAGKMSLMRESNKKIGNCIGIINKGIK